jgi:hypothetical protein
VIRKRQDGFSEVVRAWEGETVCCIASGPFLTADQCDAIPESWPVIAVNDAYKLAPWADVLYFANLLPGEWLDWHKDREEFKSFLGVRVGIEQHAKCDYPEDMHILRNLDNGVPTGLSLDPKGLKTGSNSGYQALNLAVLTGAKRIVLLGYDYKLGKKSHFFGDHPVPTNENHLRQFAQNFSSIENELKSLGVEVLNCSPDSALNQFPKVSL